MTDYRCPSCDGGFPEPDDDECPWCGEPMDGASASTTSDFAIATTNMDGGPLSLGNERPIDTADRQFQPRDRFLRGDER